MPAIVDQTSLQYVLHAAVGDTITIDADTARPIDLRIVASLDDSVLQGEILIGDAAFQRLFPEIAGYRVFLIDAGQGEAADAASQELERALEPFGFDAQSTRARLDAFHRVENTYLSTFQALGGLGLVLGCFGLIAVIARNVLERRRELALLGAAGFTGADLQKVVAIEHLLIVGVGLVVGPGRCGRRDCAGGPRPAPAPRHGTRSSGSCPSRWPGSRRPSGRRARSDGCRWWRHSEANRNTLVRPGPGRRVKPGGSDP